VTTPLLSLLIPTKDRYETLATVVGEIASWVADERLEIVICDNSAQPDAEAVQRITGADRRISYSHSYDEMSIVENTERGIGLCRGKYLCFIGDDDLVSPHIMAIVDWLDRQGGDCLIYTPARYWWRSVTFAHESKSQQPGAFWLPRKRDGAVKQHDSAAELEAVFKRGGVAYGNLPRLYHGIASQAAVQRVVDRFGRLVPGSSPDMALCLALALTTPHYLSIDYPVTVFGASRNSGGGLTAARRHYGRIEDQRMLPRDILDNWDPHLPRIFSEQVIYPQTIHEVLSRARMANPISFPTMYASLIVYEPHILPHLLPALGRYLAGKPARSIPLMIQLVLKTGGRLRTWLRGKTGYDLPFDLAVLLDPASVMVALGELPVPATVTHGRGSPPPSEQALRA